MTTKQNVKVCVTECLHCGLNRYGFRPHQGKCPRCGSYRHERWIGKPAPETVERARREDPEA